MAKTCFAEMFAQDVAPAEWLARHGTQITDEDALRAIVGGVLDAHPAEIAQYHAGKDQVIGFFVGQVMKASRGKANPGPSTSSSRACSRSDDEAAHPPRSGAMPPAASS